MSQSYCNNCGKNGHLFHQCKSPIVSYGVIAFRMNPREPPPGFENVAREGGMREFLMIRRKDTLGFIDFMRGKYSVYNKEYVLNMIKQMTNKEKMRLKTESFSTLWRDLWGSSSSTSDLKSSPSGSTSDSNLDQYKSEEINSRNKFELLRGGVYTKTDSYNLENLVDSTPSIWIEPEWGFPKGRRNYQEREYDCAVREFCEETGYKPEQLIALKNVQPVEEIFMGSNYKSYKHKYYVMCMKYEDTLLPRNVQACEVSDSSWMTVSRCSQVMRPYNIEKIRALKAVDDALSENVVFC
jgi:ADP-ribose pyrophosphatase YjhB (NUDIX family)